MLSEFLVYLEIGLRYILDLNGYDHMLFVVTLCAVYTVKDWKSVLIQVTAFTAGHCVTLILAALEILRWPASVTELLIAFSIFITAVLNIITNNQKEKKAQQWTRYFVSAVFGLVHGMGFSYLIRSLLDKNIRVLTQLLPFNLGIELGQLAIVFIVLGLSFIFVGLLKVKKREWILIVSSIAATLSFLMITERISNLY